MGKKLEYSFVKAEFEKEGYTLLSKKYINSKTKLESICSKGHKYSITWGNWGTGKRCSSCAGNIKLTIGFVKASFESEGYILLDNAYVNSRSKLNYICPFWHRHNISFSSWSSGHRCLTCADIKSLAQVILIGKVEFPSNPTAQSGKTKNTKTISKKETATSV